MFSRSKSSISPKDFRQVIGDQYSHSKFQILRMVAHATSLITSLGEETKTDILPLPSQKAFISLFGEPGDAPHSTRMYPYRGPSQRMGDWERRRARMNNQHQVLSVFVISRTHYPLAIIFLKMKKPIPK